MATKPAEEAPEQLKYKIWVLKVSIHCEGCRKKVRKVLLGIEGVYEVDVDSLQHKVTVTGNVELEALLKKLRQSGKHAELWPENPDSKSKKKKKNKSNNNNGNDQSKDGQEPTNDDDQDDNEDDHPPEAGKGGGDSRDDDESPEDEAQEDAGGIPAAAAGGGKKKKSKKNKKGKNGNPSSTVGDENSPGKVINSDTGSASQEPVVSAHTALITRSPPRPQFHPYGPPMYYQPPAPPPYGLSYNMAYPSASASYYAPPMYGHYGSDYRYYPPPQDGCTIM